MPPTTINQEAGNYKAKIFEKGLILQFKIAHNGFSSTGFSYLINDERTKLCRIETRRFSCIH